MMWYGSGGWWMFLSMLALWVGVAVLIVWAVGTARDRPAARGHDRAIAILQERYARGEIDRDEFEERRRTLEGS